ncbi:hypothetical protein HID58_034346 [Brassica napus]|uniref:Cyclin-dependent kinases regulatory subunit n=1 Tax=Brassica napus TaxID=3708 RepID=A0ABQ8C1T5_BRANA|nr:hypothetical protein HID58_034346 [Brassica napus]
MLKSGWKQIQYNKIGEQQLSQKYHWVSYALEADLLMLCNTPSLEMPSERPSLEHPDRTTTTVTSTRSCYQSYIVCIGPSWLNQSIQ